MRIALSLETLMRQPGSIFKMSTGTSCRSLNFARAGLAALALSACSTLQGHRQADAAGDSPKEILWSTPGTINLQSEVARLKNENEKLKTRVAELEKQAQTATEEKPQADAAAQTAAVGTSKEEVPPPPASSVKPDAVVASADVDSALANSPAPPVDPAPRLVQPSFASDKDAVFENEASSNTIKTASVLYGVHLASYRRVADARAGWRKLQRENPDELGLLEPRIENITIEGRGDFVRLIGGGFSTREKAEQLCARLRAKKLYCTVRAFDGQRLSMAD